jgi:hypothetical protein
LWSKLRKGDKVGWQANLSNSLLYKTKELKEKKYRQTLRNYLKPVILYCEMNGITINWKIISRGIKRGNRCSNDRPPSKEEIQNYWNIPIEG